MTYALSFNHLGNYGRLGNQMFQYAAVSAAAKELGMTATVNLSSSQLQDCFELGFAADGVLQPAAVYSERDFAYTGDLFTLPTDQGNIDVVGYFQSAKNFGDHSDFIRQEFDFKDEIRKKACDILPEGVLVSLHVRRGDYLNLQLSDTHKNQSQKYYQDAMLEFEGYRPVVFSDDIEWCKENMTWLNNNHPEPVFMSYDHFTDLCLMSLCNGHIIANSSFSWWGAWLGGGKTVAPKEWFGPSGPKDWKDVYCEDWITL
jgi:hypothetical protein